uniref:Bestrophin homolog n=1 Tax=Heterorhabditis bacteriophora TaxID=37862 RepID=A0A1I7W6Q4_HETBA
MKYRRICIPVSVLVEVLFSSIFFTLFFFFGIVGNIRDSLTDPVEVFC